MPLFRHISSLLTLFSVIAAIPSAGIEPTAVAAFQADDAGHVRIREIGGDPSAIHTDLRVFPRGWTPMAGLYQASDVRHRTLADGEAWEGLIELAEDAGRCSYRQTAIIAGTHLELKLQVTAETDMRIEGVFFWIQLPTAIFADGWAVLQAGDGWPKGVILPQAQPWDTHILTKTDADVVSVVSDSEDLKFSVKLGRRHTVQVQDDRQWHDATYGILIVMHEGELLSLIHI